MEKARNEDIRRESTKQHIARVAERLMEKTSLDCLSTKDIINAAGVSKPTFYRYFRDKQDVVLWIYESEIDKITANVDNIYQSSLACFRFELTKKNFFIRAAGYKKQNNIQDFIFRKTYEHTSSIIKRQLGHSDLPFQIELALNFYCAGCGWLWQWWCSTNMKATPEQMADMTTRFIPDILQEYLNP